MIKKWIEQRLAERSTIDGALMIAAGAAIIEAAGGHVSISNQNENFQVDVFFSNGLILR